MSQPDGKYTASCPVCFADFGERCLAPSGSECPQPERLKGPLPARSQTAKTPFRISLSGDEARIIWGLLDGALDAGACAEGLTSTESAAAGRMAEALLRFWHQHKSEDAINA